MQNESRVSKKFSELTTKKVISIVLILICFMPFFNADYFYNYPKTNEYSLHFFQNFSIKFKNDQVALKDTYELYLNHSKNLKNPLIFLKSPPFPNYNSQSIKSNELRNAEKEVNIFGNMKSIIDSRKKVKLESLLNLVRTIFVCIVLTIGALTFSKDANDLALRPLERMVSKVNRIASNPLNAKNELLLKTKKNEMETVALENSIVKIGKL